MSKYTYGDIPEEISIKPYFPLIHNMWELFKEFGFERFSKFSKDSQDTCYDFFETRFNESIRTSKSVLTQEITQTEKILSYTIILPNVSIRADLLQGTQKLFSGDSADVTYIILKHDTKEVFGLLNGHLEDGLPVDWWFVHPEDELLDRRHMKLGYKIREIPKKIKGIKKSSLRLIDILKDIRNERTPQWALADYYCINAYETFALNLLFEPSNYESVAMGWDGWGAKEIYKLPDYIFALAPWPSMLNAFMRMGRSDFTVKVAGLTTEHMMYLQPFEEKNREIFKEIHAEIWDWFVERIINRGIPYPIQTLNVEFPNLKNKSDPEKRFQQKYPKGEWINPIEELDLSLNELFEGVFLNINHQTNTNERIESTNIISTGIGRNTKFRNE
ncbi:MAG: hypothetical protein ACFFDN_12840 [Candidatus Hodarchaeota archaeon]